MVTVVFKNGMQVGLDAHNNGILMRIGFSLIQTPQWHDALHLESPPPIQIPLFGACPFWHRRFPQHHRVPDVRSCSMLKPNSNNTCNSAKNPTQIIRVIQQWMQISLWIQFEHAFVSRHYACYSVILDSWRLYIDWAVCPVCPFLVGIRSRLRSQI